MYFDDIVGDGVWLCSNYTGERRAIAEFNETRRTKKIAKNYHLRVRYPYVWWTHQIYIYHIYHDFEHRRYNDFIADREQMWLQDFIELK
jgi:hypothetical protein